MEFISAVDSHCRQTEILPASVSHYHDNAEYSMTALEASSNVAIMNMKGNEKFDLAEEL